MRNLPNPAWSAVVLAAAKHPVSHPITVQTIRVPASPPGMPPHTGHRACLWPVRHRAARGGGQRPLRRQLFHPNETLPSICDSIRVRLRSSQPSSRGCHHCSFCFRSRRRWRSRRRKNTTLKLLWADVPWARFSFSKFGRHNARTPRPRSRTIDMNAAISRTFLDPHRRISCRACSDAAHIWDRHSEPPLMRRAEDWRSNGNSFICNRLPRGPGSRQSATHPLRPTVLPFQSSNS